MFRIRQTPKHPEQIEILDAGENSVKHELKFIAKFEEWIAIHVCL